MSSAYRARVTSKGQVTLPKAVRQALGVQPGDDVAFEVDARGVTVHPVQAPSRFRAVEGRWRTGTGWSPAQTDAWVREIRGERDVEPR
jgi:antitoxin PrlF